MTEDPGTFTRRRIGQLAEDALRRSEVIGVLPTPLETVQRAVGIEQRIDMNRLPEAVAAKKPPAWSRILGAFLRDERVVFVDREQPTVRQTWTDGHEATHAMCPWHSEILRLDNETTLFRQLHPGIEEEANYGAGQLIFQGGRFHRRALREQISASTPIAMAEEYGASVHATLHFYAEEHPSPVALLISGRYPLADNSLPIWRSVESPEFRRRFGEVQSLLPGGKLSLALDGRTPALAEIMLRSRIEIDPPSTTVDLPDRGGRRHPFIFEAFFNGRCHFIQIAERKATRLGRRVRLESLAAASAR